MCASLTHVGADRVLVLVLTLGRSQAGGSRWFQYGAALASVLRQEAGPRPGASSDSRLLLDVEGPSSSEQDSPVSLGDRSLFLAGQWPPGGRRWPLELGVFSQDARPLEEEEEAAWVALRSGGEDSRPTSHWVASPGSCSSVWWGGEKGPGGLVGLAGLGLSYVDSSYR